MGQEQVQAQELTQQMMGKRLQSARTACGLTLNAAAAHLGLGRQAMHGIEAGKRAVSSAELARLAWLYGHDSQDFLDDGFQAAGALATLLQTDAAIRADSALVNLLRTRLHLSQELVWLENLLGRDRGLAAQMRFDLPVPRDPAMAIRQGEHLARRLRDLLELGVAPVGDLVELLEFSGIRAGTAELPDGMSALVLHTTRAGALIIVARSLPTPLRRHAFACGLAQALVIPEQPAVIVRDDGEDLHEVRAAAFAAAFLAPDAGVRDFVARLDKAGASRLFALLPPGADARLIETRNEAVDQAVQLHDVVGLSRRFGISRAVAILRLLATGIISHVQAGELLVMERSGKGRAMMNFLSQRDHASDAPDAFRHRFLGAAIEAWRLGCITYGRLFELTRLVHADDAEVRSVLAYLDTDAISGATGHGAA